MKAVYEGIKNANYSTCSLEVIGEQLDYEYTARHVQAALNRLEKVGLVYECMGHRWDAQWFRDPVKKEDYKDCRHGYILPNGDYYRCGYSGHNNLAVDLKAQGLIPENEDSYDYPDTHGWLKLTEAMMTDCEFCFDFEVEKGWSEKKKFINRITKEQLQFIKDYKEAKGEDIVNFNFNRYKMENLDKLFDEEGNFNWDERYELREKD